MVHAFVLLDAMPRREQDLFDSLGKESYVVARRLLKDKVGGADIVALIRGQDEADIERILANQMRSLHWLHSVRRVMAHHTIIGPVRGVMAEMEQEVLGKGR